MNSIKKALTQFFAPIVVFFIMRKCDISNFEKTTITVFDKLPPEINAATQSLNSRSAGGFKKNLLKICSQGFSKIMKVFYSNYGHASIGDCGTTNAQLDGVSMIAAKAFQDNQLYNGQELSTRFVDFTDPHFIDPVKNSLSITIFNKLFSFYKKALPLTIEHLKTVFPFKGSESKEKWESALEKRAYDILGAFIPAGTTTNVSCHMTLRQFDEMLSDYVYHPSAEISKVSKSLLRLMEKRYPATFIKKKTYVQTVSYKSDYMKNKNYFIFSDTKEILERQNVFVEENFLNANDLNDFRAEITRRKEKTAMPKKINHCGNFSWHYLIDFRSFRDLQRQRSALQTMPLLTTEYGFEQWYIEQLPEELQKEAIQLLSGIEKDVASITSNEIDRQYFIPMGYKVGTRFTVGLADMVYIVELRTQETVHPTVRTVMQEIYSQTKKILPSWFVVYVNEKLDTLSIKRGGQTIFINDKDVSKS